MKDYTSLSQAEKDALVAEASKIAYDTKFGYGNCTQSVLRALKTVFPDLEITDEIFKAAHGLLGGLGSTLLGTCGALSGAALAVSASLGRPGSDMSGDYEGCYTEIQKIVKEFEAQYKGVRCQDVMIAKMGGVYDWKTEEGLKGYDEHHGDICCAQVSGDTAGLVARMIVDGVIRF